MHRNLKVWLSLIGLLFSSLSNADTPEARVANNLSYLISPVSEGSVEQLKGMQLRKCVSKMAQAAWPEEKFLELDNELAAYNKHIDPTDMKSLILRSFPKPPEKLTSLLKDISGFVSECEEKIGIRVEF